MDCLITIGIFSFLVLLCRWLHVQTATSREKTLSQGCEPAPIIGSALNPVAGLSVMLGLLKAGRRGTLRKYFVDLLESCSILPNSRAKTVLLVLPGGRRLFTVDEANIHSILTHQNHRFNTGKRKYWFKPSHGIHTIFGSDGEDWKRTRSVMRSALTRDRINDTQIVYDNTNNLVDTIAAAAAGHKIVDVQPLALAHMLRTGAQFLGLETPDTTSEAIEDFRQASEIATAGVMERSLLNNLYWLYNTRSFRHACRRARAMANCSVKRALASVPHNDVDLSSAQYSEKRNLLEEFVTHTTDEDRLSTMVLDMMTAARQTTASLISNTLYYLARHPSVYAKLRRHVLQDFGEVATDELIRFEELKQCKYLQWCMNETLRLTPAVGFGSLTAAEDVILPKGGGLGDAPIFVPKGTNVLWNFIVLHRDPDFWGNDAEEYRPERFEDRKSTKGYLPFNAGPRTCPGQQFALTSGAYAIVRICQKFERLEDCNESGEARMSFGIVQLQMNGVKLRFTECEREKSVEMS